LIRFAGYQPPQEWLSRTLTHGVPLAIRTAGANASDHRQIIPLILEFPKVGGKPGRPKELPEEAYADRGYDSEATRALLRWLGIEPHIAKRKTPHGSGLGKVRWVVERTISWLKGLRRLRVRYDKARRDHRRLDDPGGQRHLLPHPSPRLCVVCARFVGPCYPRFD
jgi:transposase